MSRVAVLCASPRGPYWDLVASDLIWDAERDARTFHLECPVVAHPPCGPWGRLRHQCTKQDAGVGPACVAHVRRVGGVLEHPAHSTLFASEGMPPPGYLSDAWGGFTVETTLGAFGDGMLKRTWLYIVGCADVVTLPPLRRVGVFKPVEHLSSWQRQVTPRPMARFLLDLAAKCAAPGGA